MNLAETLAHRGVETSASVTKAQEMGDAHMMSDEESTLNAYGIANDSFHWGVMDIVPPRNTTEVTNPGTELDKKKRKSKSFRKYEARLQQNSIPRKQMVQVAAIDNTDIVDVHRSAWFC